jgi:hypothetical protein
MISEMENGVEVVPRRFAVPKCKVLFAPRGFGDQTSFTLA